MGIQLFKKCTIWSVIKSFTNIEYKELSGNNINSLTNVITLDTGVHKFFGPLRIWFEAVPVRSICFFVTYHHLHLVNVMPQRVRLTLTKSRRLRIVFFVVREPNFVVLHYLTMLSRHCGRRY